MTCQRCCGLLVEDHFIDLGVQESGDHLWLRLLHLRVLNLLFLLRRELRRGGGSILQ